MARAGLAVIAASAVALGAASAAAQPPAGGQRTAIRRRIAILGFDALGMDQDKVARLETLFRMELERLVVEPTPSRREIARALKNSPLRRCSGDTACLASIGKKLRVELVVSGNVAALSDSYIINIKVVDATSGAELRRIASDPLRGNPDDLIESVRVAAYRLLAPEQLLGSISILADISGAEVVVDGQRVGTTPLSRPIERLSLGRHRLEVRAPGYSAFTEEVVVRFQKTTRVEVHLVAADATAGARRTDLVRPGRGSGTRPAPRRWYRSPWVVIGVGLAAVVVGGLAGRALAGDGVVDCDASPESCR